MTTKLGDALYQKVRQVGKERRLCAFQIVTNGTGGVTSVTGDDPRCGAADGGANGDLDITFPACPEGVIFLQLKSAALTVCYAFLSAMATESGTATVITGKNATNTDPASGDIIYVEVWGTVSP